MSKRRPLYRESSGVALHETAESIIAPVDNAKTRVILICYSLPTLRWLLFFNHSFFWSNGMSSVATAMFPSAHARGSAVVVPR
jgi:hypothetical protein